jgi:hypothetical protein
MLSLDGEEATQAIDGLNDKNLTDDAVDGYIEKLLAHRATYAEEETS